MQGPAEIANTIRQRLNALATSQGRPPNMMAAAMQITEGQMMRIYKGEAGVTAVQLVLAAQALGVNSSVITGEMKYTAPEASEPAE